jgi:hypothetical protein
MKKIFILIFLLTLPNCYPQVFDNIAKNIVYLDLGVFLSRGIGTIGIGLNYERMLSNNISIRAGVNFGLFGVADGGDAFSGTGVGFPVTINYMTNNKNKFEAGIGGGPHFELGDYKKKGVEFFPAVRLGYRYQPEDNSVIYKIGAEVPANFYLSVLGAGYHF